MPTTKGWWIAMTVGVVALAAASGAIFVAGVTLGAFSALRQLVWMRRVSAIPDPDVAPG